MTYFASNYSQAPDLCATMSWSDNTLLDSYDVNVRHVKRALLRLPHKAAGRVITSQSSERDEQRQTMAPRSAPALPDLVITSEVSEREEHKRTLMGIFRRLHELDQISLKTSMYAGWFIRSLPTTRSLPKVSPDGDGGLQMAWDVEGSGRTLITINDEMLYGVISAGTRSASYLDERQFMGVVEEDFLAAIPA